jgi:hypothetical protein
LGNTLVGEGYILRVENEEDDVLFFAIAAEAAASQFQFELPKTGDQPLTL